MSERRSFSYSDAGTFVSRDWIDSIGFSFLCFETSEDTDKKQ